jgi:hypothetical protein
VRLHAGRTGNSEKRAQLARLPKTAIDRLIEREMGFDVGFVVDAGQPETEEL